METPLEQREGLIKAPTTQELDVDGRPDQNKAPSLQQSRPSWFWRAGISALLLAVPLGYVALIVIVSTLSNKDKSPFGDNVMQLLQVVSTIWPISFAAVMGPFLKTLALHYAERGSTLGSLEFLLSSQTTMAAIKNLATIRHVRLWSVGVVLAWCLSPLGGQAAVRSLTLDPRSYSQVIPAISYMGAIISDMSLLYSGSNTDVGTFAGASGLASLLSGMKSIISASFYTPAALVSHSNGSSSNFDAAVNATGGGRQAARLGQQDLWRNVRIPFMELLPGYDAQRPDAWIPVPSDVIVPYASLIGLPIRGGSLRRAGNSTMLVQTHYQTLSCGQAFDGTAWTQNGSGRLYFHSPRTGYPPHTDAGQFHPRLYYSGLYSNILLDIVNDTQAIADHLSSPLYPNVEPPTKLELIWAGHCDGDRPSRDKPMLHACKISTTYIDIQVGCTRSSSFSDLECRAARVRHIPGLPIAGNLTALSSSMSMDGIIPQMPFTTASYHVAGPSSLEMYIRDPPQLISRSRLAIDSNGPSCFTGIPSHVFETRLATALNTFIMAMYNTSVLTGMDSVSPEKRSLAWKDTTAEWSEFGPSVYTIHKAWFCLWLASSLILLICAATGFAVRCFTRAPDFLDSIVGLTRDSPYIQISEGGSGMSGSDRLQMVKNIKVRICDVTPEAEVGRIALTTQVGGPKLGWKRAYF